MNLNEWPNNLWNAILNIQTFTDDESCPDMDSSVLYWPNLDTVLSATLDERQQALIYMRYEQYKTYKEIGNEVGISGERVRQIIVYSLYKLRQNHNFAQLKALPESEFLRLREENRLLTKRLDELIRQINHPSINSEDETDEIKKQAEISLDSPVEYLDIPIYYAQRLNKNKIYTVEELINCTEFTLGRFRGVGKVFLAKIKSALKKYGYELRRE